ncbi:MAG: RidA family protein [Gammaproteobacteria bacterium]|nr:RidA family protein [Gammaproteobacteria bacterium]
MSEKQVISTGNAPDAIGPYSQAIRAGDFVYLSGQIPLDPATMEVVEGEFRDRAVRVFTSLDAVARAAGGSLQDVVKLNVYLTDLGRFADVNEVMSEFLAEPYPARAAVGVASLPKGVDIEIEGVLYLGR